MVRRHNQAIHRDAVLYPFIDDAFMPDKGNAIPYERIFADFFYGNQSSVCEHQRTLGQTIFNQFAPVCFQCSPSAGRRLASAQAGVEDGVAAEAVLT